MLVLPPVPFHYTGGYNHFTHSGFLIVIRPEYHYSLSFHV